MDIDMDGLLTQLYMIWDVCWVQCMIRTSIKSEIYAEQLVDFKCFLHILAQNMFCYCYSMLVDRGMRPTDIRMDDKTDTNISTWDPTIAMFYRKVK